LFSHLYLFPPQHSVMPTSGPKCHSALLINIL
jgi:hypothetical protein